MLLLARMEPNLLASCQRRQHAEWKKISQQRPAPNEGMVMMPLVLLVESLPCFRQRALGIGVNRIEMWRLKVFDKSHEASLLPRQVGALYHHLP